MELYFSQGDPCHSYTLFSLVSRHYMDGISWRGRYMDVASKKPQISLQSSSYECFVCFSTKYKSPSSQ